MELIRILLVAVPLIFLTVTVGLSVNSCKKLKHYSECTGIIERFHEQKTPMSDTGKVSISPVVSYQVNGKSYELMGNYCSTRMKIGQEISILYCNEEPSKATIKKGLYVAPMITGGLTLFFGMALVGFLVLESKGIIGM